MYHGLLVYQGSRIHTISCNMLSYVMEIPRRCWLPEVPSLLLVKQESWDDCSWSKKNYFSLLVGSSSWLLEKLILWLFLVYVKEIFLSHSLDDAIFDQIELPIPGQFIRIQWWWPPQTRYFKGWVSPNGHSNLWHSSFDFHVCGLCF